MSWRRRNLTQAQIDEILYASDSDSELSSEDDGWPTEDADQSFLVETEINEDNRESEELPPPILNTTVQDVNENDKIDWSGQVDNYLIHQNPKIPRGGPVYNLSVGSSPFDYFKLLFSTSMCETIRTNTNKYAEFVQKEKNVADAKWRPIEHLSEIWNFLAVILIMSIAKFLKMKNYWATNPILGNEMVKKTMSRDRFMKILKYFHISDREMEKAPNDDGFYLMQKLDPLMTEMKKNFKNHFKPNQNMSVDEAMIKYKGRLGIVQYMPNKPTKRGIKIWMLCDSSFGYVYDFDVYCGKKDKIPRSKKGLGYDVVNHLSKSLESGHHVYFDRFFTSVPLMRDLLARGIYSCGTVQTNRKFLSKDLGKIKLKTTGESKCFQCTDEPNLLCTIWKDKSEIFFLSTGHKNSEATVSGRIGSISTTTACPAAAKNYNKCMGGVNLADQKRQYYDVARKSCKWWIYLFWFLLNSAVDNAHVLYQLSNMPELQKGKILFDFKLGMIEEMTIKRAHGIKRTIQAPNLCHKRVKIEGRKKVCRRCCKLKVKTVGNNSIQSSWMCTACQVCLCVDCFGPYHDEI